MFEGVGAAILGFLVQYAGTDLLDGLLGERIDTFRANRDKQKVFDRSVAGALAEIEQTYPGHARIFAKPEIPQAPCCHRAVQVLFRSRAAKS